MNTKLIPPNITPGPWKTDGKIHDGNYFVECPEGWDVASVTTAQTGNSHSVAKFISAAPAMAEALADSREAMINMWKLLNKGKSPQNDTIDAATAALLSDGYKFTPVDAE